jgi:hypothetical protein
LRSPNFNIKYCTKFTYDSLTVDDILNRKRKPMTNADHIRSMSDEELAKWLDKIVVNCHKDCCEGCPLEDSCWSDGISEFLKQPYKEKEE